MNNNKTIKFLALLSSALGRISLLFVVSLFTSFSPAFAAEHCSDEFYIDQTFPNGARWDMCWEHKQREGIILNKVYYTPKNGDRRMVLNKAALAQIHVPYDDNGTRFHDISDYGVGGQFILDLNPDECPSGTLLNTDVLVDVENQLFINKKLLCQQVEQQSIAFKNDDYSAQGYALSLFSISAVGAYYYIPKWVFKDDGTIEPWIGATGALQRFGTDSSKGWVLGDERVGVAHLHNFYWKLDFDLDGSFDNDVVEEVNFELINGQRQRRASAFSSETARSVNPDTMRHWRIRDASATNSNAHTISYDILLKDMGYRDVGPASEPFTHNDFYVTKQRSSERFASHNTTGGKNLAEFVNDESLSNEDIVVWAGVTFYHMPRSEDAPHMNAHWSHLQIKPRDWTAKNTLSTQENNPPVEPPVDPPVNTPGKGSGGSIPLPLIALGLVLAIFRKRLKNV